MALPVDADIPLILSRIRIDAEWRWAGGAFNDPANLIWDDGIQVEPTEGEMNTEWTAIVTEQAIEQTLLQTLKTEYSPLAGRSVSSLTNTETRLLVEILVYIMGGIDENRNLKTAAKWDAAREILGV